MKKSKLINSEISYEIAKMGHTNGLVIGDSGLPIPNDVKCIDLALTKNIPTFLDVLNSVIEELFVEEMIIADEMKVASKDLYEELMEIKKDLEAKQGNEIAIHEVPHETFKKKTEEARCIVRTGEFTPYANVILKSGVVF